MVVFMIFGSTAACQALDRWVTLNPKMGVAPAKNKRFGCKSKGARRPLAFNM